MDSVKQDFVSVGCNRVVNALDWGDNGYVAFGGHFMTVVYDPQQAKNVATLVGHSGQVNCVLWVPSALTPELPKDCALLLSGSTDSTVRVWKLCGLQAGKSSSVSGTCVAVLQGHTGPVTSLGTYPIDASSFMLASSAGDEAVRIWTRTVHAAGSDSAAASTSAVTIATASTTGAPPTAAPAAAAAETATAAAATAAAAAATHTAEAPHTTEAAAPAVPPTTAAAAAAATTAATDDDVAPPPGAMDWYPAPAPTAAPMLQQASVQSDSGEWILMQSIHVGSHLQHAVALTHLPSLPGWILLATGGTDSMVQLYTRPPSGIFSLSCKLSGHENWVRSLSFCHVGADAGDAGDGQSTEVLLASASQDRYGRIWSVCLAGSGSGASTKAADPLTEMIARYAPKPTITANELSYSVTLEALLIGHDDWVHSVTWQRGTATAETTDNLSHTLLPGQHRPQKRSAMNLLSSSMDRSMIIWNHEAKSGLWMNQATIGDAGASCLGYFGGVFSPGAHFLMAHGFTGALHLWERLSPSTSSSAATTWQPRHALGGHFGAVTDACWGVDGSCLMTVSKDQTARMFTAVGAEAHWCEIARMQVHGHDFTCLASIPCPPPTPTDSTSSAALLPSNFMFVSGSEEKILRAFEAPQAFLDTLDMARGRAPGTTLSQLGSAATGGSAAGAAAGGRRTRALGAAVGALGLSNKALYQDVDAEVDAEGSEAAAAASAASGMEEEEGGLVGLGDYNEGPDIAPSAAPSAVAGPPLEEHLSQNTLWPEVHKMYGHGNDIFCVAASPDGRYLASACVAKSAQAAAVWIWRTAEGGWRAVTQLQVHSLTVTHLAWSHDGSCLLACSRDRSFSLFRRSAPQPSTGVTQAPNQVASDDTFSLLHRVKSAHARVIWGASWSHDDALLATGARDGCVKIWSLAAGGSFPSTSQDAAKTAQPTLVLPTFPSAVTALAFAKSQAGPAASEPAGGSSSSSSGSEYLLAVGLESGVAQLWRLARRSGVGSGPSGDAVDVVEVRGCVWSSGAAERHAAAINAICWRVGPAGDGRGMQFATCGDDHSLRVFTWIP